MKIWKLVRNGLDRHFHALIRDPDVAELIGLNILLTIQCGEHEGRTAELSEALEPLVGSWSPAAFAANPLFGAFLEKETHDALQHFISAQGWDKN